MESQFVSQDKLPLEYPSNIALSIYRGRVRKFFGTIFLGLIVFAFLLLALWSPWLSILIALVSIVFIAVLSNIVAIKAMFLSIWLGNSLTRIDAMIKKYENPFHYYYFSSFLGRSFDHLSWGQLLNRISELVGLSLSAYLDEIWARRLGNRLDRAAIWVTPGNQGSSTLVTTGAQAFELAQALSVAKSKIFLFAKLIVYIHFRWPRRERIHDWYPGEWSLSEGFYLRSYYRDVYDKGFGYVDEALKLIVTETQNLRRTLPQAIADISDLSLAAKLAK
jgi:hypothetical protein